MFLLRNFGADYVATGVLVEVVYQLMVLIVWSMLSQESNCLIHDIPHVGSWAETDMWICSWTFLMDAKHAFNKPPPSHSGWLINICAVQHVWRMLKKGRFHPSWDLNLNQDPPWEHIWCSIIDKHQQLHFFTFKTLLV
jgi:hypothetical protein